MGHGAFPSPVINGVQGCLALWRAGEKQVRGGCRVPPACLPAWLGKLLDQKVAKNKFIRG